MKSNTISISTSTILKTVLIAVAVWFLWFVRDIILLFLVSLLLAALIEPFADWFATRHIPRVLSVLIVYIVLFAVVAMIIIGVVPIIVHQSSQLVSNLSMYSTEIENTIDRAQTFTVQHGFAQDISSTLTSIQNSITDSFGSIFSTVRGFFGSIATTILILVLTFYMVAEGDKMQKYFKSLAPPEYQPFVSDVLKKIQIKIGAWMRGQFILGLCVGGAVYVGLSLLGVKYALLLAIIAGILEIVPYIGPIFSFIPAAIIAFTQSPILAVAVAAMFIFIQQVENHLLVPKIMQKATGLNPVISIIALLVGVKIAGVAGAIFAIPLATTIVVIIENIYKDYHQI